MPMQVFRHLEEVPASFGPTIVSIGNFDGIHRAHLAVLHELWSELPMAGANLTRRWERRFALSTELLIKEGYARLIKVGTQSVYDEARPLTTVVISRAPEIEIQAHPEFVAASASGTPMLARLPRYEAFTATSRWLAVQGIDFREIAGNDGEVVVSLLVPTTWQAPATARMLFEQPILTRPGQKRAVLAVPVPRLAAMLRALDRRGIGVEHVYDF